MTPVKPLTKWLVLTVAAIGFLFDTYELLMLPVIARPALSEILQVPANHPDVAKWVGQLLWIAALCGGVFGLLGGYLIDRFGRKTIMVASILMYSLSPVAAALSTSLEMFVFFRCTTFIGVCVEFVAAVTWLAELFADKHQRERAIGWTLAFASVGGLLVTGVYQYALEHAATFPALPVAEPFNPHAPWRYTLTTGLVPGLLILLLLPFVPESAVWRERKASGTLKRPSFGELFSPALLRTTLVTTALSACAYACAFGALQLTPPQMVPGLPEFAQNQEDLKPLRAQSKALNEKVSETAPGSPERKAAIGKVVALRKLTEPLEKPVQDKGAYAQLIQELGGLTGRILLALLLAVIVSRSMLIRLFQIPGLIVFPITYYLLYRQNPELFIYGVFVCGLVTVAQFSYFGEYLPKVFPVHLRGTGGSFATNVGGRMIGTMAAVLNTSVLAPMLSNTPIPTPQAYATAAAIIGGVACLVGFVLSFMLPKPIEE